MDIDLLLARADDQAPALDAQVPMEAAATAPKPPDHRSQEGPGNFRYDAGDPQSLEDQRWGLVVPQGPLGDRLLALVAPLIAARRDEQGAEPVVHRVPPDMDAEAASRFWSDVYLSDEQSESDIPRYLLLLGDASAVSWELQHRLSADVFVGRLCFRDEAGYEAYVHKVLSAERKAPQSPSKALFCTIADGSPATKVGHAGLLSPALEQVQKEHEKGTFKAGDIEHLTQTESLSAGDLVRAVATDRPTLLFSISNGCGAPKAGWKSHEEQLRIQGSMVLGKGERLMAEDLAERPFLPGGAWLYFACFGAGTPRASAYHHWLAALRDMGLYGGNLEGVLRSLPGASARPFVAALPQAALANPSGPLAVMGHVDLAWTFSFQDPNMPGRYRQSRFLDIFRSIVDGKRFGSAYHRLARFFTQTSTDLTAMYDQDARRKAPLPPEEDKARRLRKALLWMLRQDLAAYVLLGDPAARLMASKSSGAASEST